MASWRVVVVVPSRCRWLIDVEVTMVEARVDRRVDVEVLDVTVVVEGRHHWIGIVSKKLYKKLNEKKITRRQETSRLTSLSLLDHFALLLDWLQPEGRRGTVR